MQRLQDKCAMNNAMRLEERVPALRKVVRACCLGLGVGLLGGVGSLVLGLPAEAYEVAEVPDGGRISGTVALEGPAPKAFQFKLTMGAYPKHCAAIASEDGYVRLPRARISKSRGVADTVVFIQELERGKPPSSEAPVLTVGRCRFDRLVMAVMDERPMRIRMEDSVLHPLRGWEMVQGGRIPLFHLPDLAQGEEKSVEVKTRRSGIVKVECDQHRYMQAWILVPINPYFAVTDAEGRFAIDGIPPGRYVLGAWHPALGYLEREVTVQGAGQATGLRFTFVTDPS